MLKKRGIGRVGSGKVRAPLGSAEICTGNLAFQRDRSSGIGLHMPHLRFRGFDPARLETFAPSLPAPLAELFGCPEDWITLEAETSRFLAGPPSPMIEITWFQRENSVRDAVAALLYRAAPDAAVVFRPVSKGDYYENGKNFEA